MDEYKPQKTTIEAAVYPFKQKIPRIETIREIFPSEAFR